MSSDDTNTKRVSTDLLEQLIKRVHVDDLEMMEAPWDHDIGQATVRDSVFGKLSLPVVQDGKVIWNGDIVEAERIDPKDQGEVIVVDITELEWAPERGELFALGEFTAAQNTIIDHKALADMVLRLSEWDRTAVELAGWDDGEVQGLLDAIERGDYGAETFDADGLPLDDDAPPADRDLLDVLDVSVAEPTHEVIFGQVWSVGPHVLVIGSVMKDHGAWSKYLEDDDTMFVPYPSPLIPAVATVPEGQTLLMVQPDTYLAGHLLDKWVSIHGENTIGLL